jgi:hypothetical protein
VCLLRLSLRFGGGAQRRSPQPVVRRVDHSIGRSSGDSAAGVESKTRMAQPSLVTVERATDARGARCIWHNRAQRNTQNKDLAIRSTPKALLTLGGTLFSACSLYSETPRSDSGPSGPDAHGDRPPLTIASLLKRPALSRLRRSTKPRAAGPAAHNRRIAAPYRRRGASH